MTTNQDQLAAYEGLRARVVELVEGLDEAATRVTVPATPAWRVHDLLAHLVGVAADVGAGRTEGAGSDAWTAAQVEQRHDHGAAELLDEWGASWPAFAAAVAAADPFRAGQIVFDATTHEHDLRGALDRPGGRDADAMDLAWRWATAIVGQMRDGYGAGALEIRTPHGSVVVGSGDPTAGVAGDRFELFRAMTGRRSADQVAAYDWEGGPAVDHLCLLPPRDTPLVE